MDFMVQGVGFLVNYHDSDEFGGAVAEGHPQVAVRGGEELGRVHIHNLLGR